MPKLPFAAALCLSTLVLTAARADAQILPAEDHVVEVAVMGWRVSPDFVLSTEAIPDASVNDVDFVQEFGLGDKTLPAFRAVIGGVHKLRIGYASLKYDADTTIQRTFTYRNRTFTVNAPASTDINWTLWTFGYEWDLLSREYGFLGAIVDLKYNKVEALIDSPALESPSPVETHTTVVVPTLGAIGRAYLTPAVAITGEFTGFRVNVSDLEVNSVDFDVYGTISFGRNYAVQGGYRSFAIDYLVKKDSGGDLKMRGPYIGGVLRF